MDETPRRPPYAQLTDAAAPVLLLLVAMASMQLGAAYAKSLFPTIGPQGATTLRLAFSALILAAAQRPWRGLRRGRATVSLSAYGLSLGSMNTLFYMALRTTPIGIAIALEFVGPLAVALATSRRPADLFWVLLTISGLLLLLPLWRSAQAIDPAGAVLALASGGFWAIYIVFGRRVGQSFGAHGTGLGMLIAAIVFVPIGVAEVGPTHFPLAVLPAGLALALLSSALPYSLEMIALTKLPARAFGTLMSLEPAMGALAGLAILGERPTPLQWIGMSAIILASAGTTLGLRSAAA